jgi:hypothetical protein
MEWFGKLELKHEDEIDGEVVGPLFWAYAGKYTLMQRVPNCPAEVARLIENQGGWVAESQAKSIAKQVSLRLTCG